MDFEITHVTDYTYANAAAEAYLETRLSPPELPTQTIGRWRLKIEPKVKTSSYTDYFGNRVDFFSLPYRHRSLTIATRAEVRTQRVERPTAALEVSIEEARQIFADSITETFDYLQPTDIVLKGREALQWAHRYLRGAAPLGEALENLNRAVYQTFAYASGATTNSTPLHEIWKNKRGVCQDFAHIMLSVLRTAGLPSRYICGYIEAVAPPSASADNELPGRGSSRTLVGAIATHAWVEVLVPGMTWVALDPTNDQWCGERHVTVSRGRDFRDTTPVRGTFKGSGKQNMKVKVFMRRKEVRPAPRPAVEGSSAGSPAERAAQVAN